MMDKRIESLLRDLAPQVLTAVVRRYGNFGSAEDAVQEALVEASTVWDERGLPDDPKAWLITVASRRLTDILRREQARRRREEKVARWTLSNDRGSPPEAVGDDALILLFMCCHPALTTPSQIALTLRAVGGLTTEEVARAFLVPVDTMTRRISRAKQSILDVGVGFRKPSEDEIQGRLAAVLHVLYLIFNEGYSATSGPFLYRHDLCADAIRLTRMVRAQFADEPEVAGLLGLMLLTDARRPARATPDRIPIPLAEQDRTLWNRPQITEGIALLNESLPRSRPGPYQIQAAIAALHDEAPSVEETDWPQIEALYRKLLQISANPMVGLSHAVAVAHVEGPAAGLARVERVAEDHSLEDDHRLHSVRGHLLEMNGDISSAAASFEAAAERTTSLPHQRYLNAQANRLRQPGRWTGNGPQRSAGAPTIGGCHG
ncbi:MAG: sigma-70 family RNA polymerase sigma factor [Actinobacteria bacterium]|nr:sigma-70 family RNA polymerase sigma factor [Actinomycetota bacterium]